MDERQLARRVLSLGDESPVEETVALLAGALAEAYASFPELALPEDRWARYLAERLPVGEESARQRANLRVDELFLCCGCVAGDPVAVRLFHERFVPLIDNALRKMSLGAALREELKQALIVKLLVGEHGGPPELAGFRGLGRLAVWLRVLVTRAARKAVHRAKKEVPGDDQRIEQELVALQAELPQLKREYREAFRRAFREALGTLAPRDKNLLRYRYADGLNLEHIGAIFNVHLSTIHRWLEKLQLKLLQETHRVLADELRVPAGECSTIIRMIESDFDMTLNTLMGRAASAAQPEG